jgi:hypothetical protein
MLKKKIILSFNAESPFGLDVKEEYMVEHKDAVIHAMKQPYELKEGDNYYFLPDVSIPRFKIKSMCEKFKVKSTRSSESADYIFIGSLGSKSTSAMSTQEVTYDTYLKMINPESNAMLDTLALDFPKEFTVTHVDLLNKSKMFDILIKESDTGHLQEWLQKQTGRWKWFSFGFDTKKFISLKSPKLYTKLRYQDEILSAVNSDSIIITDDKRIELQAMFNSNDADNIILAMEIMANSNYEESILNNYFLLLDNLTRISNQQSSSHRNFQGFLMFYGVDLRRLSSKINTSETDSIASILKDYGKLTKENMEKLLKYYAEKNGQFRGNFCNNILVPNSEVEYDG